LVVISGEAQKQREVPQWIHYDQEGYKSFEKILPIFHLSFTPLSDSKISNNFPRKNELCDFLALEYLKMQFYYIAWVVVSIAIMPLFTP
jgi:hypothetical protein